MSDWIMCLRLQRSHEIEVLQETYVLTHIMNELPRRTTPVDHDIPRRPATSPIMATDASTDARTRAQCSATSRHLIRPGTGYC